MPKTSRTRKTSRTVNALSAKQRLAKAHAADQRKMRRKSALERESSRKAVKKLSVELNNQARDERHRKRELVQDGCGPSVAYVESEAPLAAYFKYFKHPDIELEWYEWTRRWRQTPSTTPDYTPVTEPRTPPEPGMPAATLCESEALRMMHDLKHVRASTPAHSPRDMEEDAADDEYNHDYEYDAEAFAVEAE